MKEILAFIRPDKVTFTKKMLEQAGFWAYTCRKCRGRGKKPMEAYNADDGGHPFMAKHAFMMMVEDDKAEWVVRILIRANRTENPGDGKIFVLPVQEAYTVRTGEQNV